MARSLRIATNLAADNRHLVYVLGAEPDGPDQELGYIVPNETRHDAAAGVLRFVEKDHASHVSEEPRTVPDDPRRSELSRRH
jgi:mannose-1-phosphate guanylyltransferase